MSGHEATRSRLAAVWIGPTAGPPVVFLHGFAQTGRCGGPVIQDLARDHSVCLVDLPGHGRSARHRDADMWRSAELLLATLDRPDPVTVVGYSMGARLGLHVALLNPSAVSSLVLIGGTAGIEAGPERAARRAEDRALAEQVQDLGVSEFLDGWMARPMFSGLAEWARFRDERLTNTRAGLASSLRNAGTGAMEPLWDRLSEIQVPALFLSGGNDQKFRSLAERMAAAVGSDATSSAVSGSGHAAHLEAPDAVLALVRPFLRD